MKKIICFFIMGILSAGLIGCSTLSKENLKEQPAPLQSQVILKFNDIPVPMGFKLLPEESYSFENSGIRVAVLKYRGKASSTQLINFFKEQMPMFNWSVLNIVEYGNCMLNLERENETCVINIIPKGNTATIQISLGPKSQVSPKKSKQLIK